MNNRRFTLGSQEINMTSMLDVLFCILFIVMLGSNFNEQTTKNNMQKEIDEKQQQIEAYESYREDATIIVVTNTTEDKSRDLLFKINEDEDVFSIKLGTDRTESISDRINIKIKDIVDNHKDNPVYLFFNCDKKGIYTVEYNAIINVFEQLQDDNKEFFYKVKEK